MPPGKPLDSNRYFISVSGVGELSYTLGKVPESCCKLRENCENVCVCMYVYVCVCVCVCVCAVKGWWGEAAEGESYGI